MVDIVFAIVPAASAIDAARARINAGGAVTPEDGIIANTNTSREDVAMWFIQEAMRLTGWLASRVGPVFVENPGASAYVVSLAVTQYHHLFDAICHAARHAHYCPPRACWTWTISPYTPTTLPPGTGRQCNSGTRVPMQPMDT